MLETLINFKCYGIFFLSFFFKSLILVIDLTNLKTNLTRANLKINTSSNVWFLFDVVNRQKATDERAYTRKRRKLKLRRVAAVNNTEKHHEVGVS